MTEEKYIALTFDDGPSAVITNKVLDYLEEEAIPATFFLIGKKIDKSRSVIIRRALSLGCEIANHSFTHPGMPALTEKDMQTELRRTSDRIEKVTGKRPAFFRPPYIAVDERMFTVMGESEKMTFICGDGCDDWNPEVGVAARVEGILKTARPGNVILLHDMAGNHGTVEAIKQIVPTLKKQGYQFVTVSDMFCRYGVKPKADTLYSNVFQKTRFPWGDKISAS